MQTREWDLYQKGLDYKRKINLFAENDKNERFFSGDQWYGVKANGLPTPILNVLKRVGVYKLSQILSNAISVKFGLELINEAAPTEQEAYLINVCETLTDYLKTLWENQKQDIMNRRILKDGFITGDGIVYSYFDPNKETGQPVKGDICNEVIKNVNYIPGNPNDNRVQTQPYIILVFRQLVSELVKEARLNGISEEQIQLITSDTSTENTYGDKGKIELDDSGKCNCLLYMWRDENGRIWFKKSTQYVEIKPQVQTTLKRYPVAMMNWEERENSCHGVSEVKSQIPNQIVINKLLAAVIHSVFNTAFPKAVYDKTFISKWTNAIGEAIAIDTPTDKAINQIAGYLPTGQTSPEIYRLLQDVITYTKEMMGANEVALGEVKPENTSAFIAVNQAISVPLEDVQARFYDFQEDLALNQLDLMLAHYGERQISIKQNNVSTLVTVNFAELQSLQFKTKVDVGPSSKWSEIASMQTLDGLLKAQQITFVDYLERVPDGIIPKKQELLEKYKQIEEMQKQQAMQMQQMERQMALQQQYGGGANQLQV